MFEKNLKAIEAKDRKLADLLRSPGCEKIGLEGTRDGNFTFKHNGIYFHSRYNPVKEAEAQAKDLISKKPDWIILFGLGCGYLLKELVGAEKDRIIVFEPEIKILKAVLENIDLSPELSSENVFLCADADSVASKVRGCVDGMDNLVCYQSNPYVQAFSAELKEFTNKVRNAHTTNKVGISTQIDSCKLWIDNYFGNVKAFGKYPPIDTLKDAFKGVPLVIAGAGPSLKKNAHLLRELKGKALIIAAVTAYKPLLKFGVVPDFVIAAEKVDLPEYFTYGKEDMKTRFILGEVSHPNMFGRDVKGKFVYFNAYNGLSLEQAKFWGSAYFPSSGGSVTTSAFDIGLMFGCDPVIFVGQDMSFGDGRTHVPGGVYVSQDVRIDTDKNEIVIEEDYVTPEMTERRIKNKFPLLWLKGLDGKPVASKYDWVTFHQWFEKHMDYLRETGSHVRVINATEGGAYIEGMEHATLKEAISGINEEKSIEAVITEAERDRKDPDRKSLSASFRRMEESLRSIRAASGEIVKEAKSALKSFKASGMNAELIKNVEKIKKLEEKLFKKAESAGFLWEAVVSFTYVLKEYQRDIESEDTSAQFYKDLTTIIESYGRINEACKMYIPVLKEAEKAAGGDFSSAADGGAPEACGLTVVA